MAAVHYYFVVIDLFQSTLAFSEDLSCGSLPCYCYRYLFAVVFGSGDQGIMFLTTELPLFCIYSDTQCNLNGSTLLAG